MQDESGKGDSAKRQKLQHREGESGGSAAAANNGSAVSSSVVCQTTAKQLQAKLAAAPSSIYGTTTADVIQVLGIWDKQFAHVAHMSSFLRTESRLLHETEECIVALHHFKEWWDKQQGQQSTSSSTSIMEPLTVVDVGCGKGYYSMFLSYLIGFVWNKQDTTTTTGRRPVQSIILIDKTSRQEINWSHLDTANQTAQVEGRPRLELWDATNLHHYDALVDRLQARKTRLAITGVHLCKMLSPALISLVNGLRDICDYCCLAPCCLPRSVTKGKCRLAIYQYETPEVRQRRLQFKAQRQVSRTCALCGSNQHVASACPTAPDKNNDTSRTQVLHQAMQTLPCWKCGTLGHFAAQCALAEKQRVTPQARTWIVPPPPPPPPPPTDKNNNNSNNNNNNPFEMYCQVLAQAFEGKTTQIVHAGLVNDKVAKHSREDDKKNWNGQRKSVFLVATAD